MNVWFWGDLHGGHERITKHRNLQCSESEHWEMLKESHHKHVNKRDQVWFLGDCVFTHERLEDIKSWSGSKKKLILGNHCTEKLHIKDLVNVFDEIHGMVKYHEFWLSHAPIHENELRGKVNIHGHVHMSTIDDWRYFNACPEVNGYRPISLFEIRQEINRRK